MAENLFAEPTVSDGVLKSGKPSGLSDLSLPHSPLVVLLVHQTGFLQQVLLHVGSEDRQTHRVKGAVTEDLKDIHQLISSSATYRDKDEFQSGDVKIKKKS